MKKFISVLLCFGYLFSQAQSFKPQVGDKLVYAVDADGQQYNFTIVIKSLSPDISFAWQMSNEAQSHGKITIPAAAMANSNKMYNYFSNGDKILKGMTSVFLSRATIKKLIKSDYSDTTDIYDGERKLGFINNGGDGFDYKKDGEYAYFKALYLYTEDNLTLTVAKDTKYPLILSMEIGFKIHLIDYITVSKKVHDLSSLIKKKITDPKSEWMWSKLNNSAVVDVQDLTHAGDDKRLYVSKSYFAYTEGLMLETLNDTVTKIVYYPQPILIGAKQYYGAHFPISQVKNFSLNRPDQEKAITEKFVKATLYDADSYALANNRIMEIYYHIPKPIAGGGIAYSGAGLDLQPAGKQKAAFVTFE